MISICTTHPLRRSRENPCKNEQMTRKNPAFPSSPSKNPRKTSRAGLYEKNIKSPRATTVSSNLYTYLRKTLHTYSTSNRNKNGSPIRNPSSSVNERNLYGMEYCIGTHTFHTPNPTIKNPEKVMDTILGVSTQVGMCRTAVSGRPTSCARLTSPRGWSKIYYGMHVDRGGGVQATAKTNTGPEMYRIHDRTQKKSFHANTRIHTYIFQMVFPALSLALMFYGTLTVFHSSVSSGMRFESPGHASTCAWQTRLTPSDCSEPLKHVEGVSCCPQHDL